MERPNNNQPPYRYNTNIEPPINQPPQQPQSSHGGNTVQPPPPAHMYNQHAYSYNTNNVAGTSQPPQPTHFGHVVNTARLPPPAHMYNQDAYSYNTNNMPGTSQPPQPTHFSHSGNTARLPPPAHMNNQTLFWNNTNNAPCNTNPPRPTQFSCGGNTAKLPARAHMNNQHHRINSVSGTCQPPHFGQVVNTARLPPPAHMNKQPHSVPWNSQPSQPLTHGPNTAMPTQTTAGCSLAPLQNHIQASLGFWLQCVNEWYPDRHKKTYFLPHLFFRKTQHRIAALDHLGNLPVLVPEPPPKKPKLEQVPLYPPPLAQTHPTLPVAGSVFTLPHSDPAPLPRFIETDVLDDYAAERLLRCLRVLSKEHHEVMMVISQLDFRKYLDNDTDPISTAACANLSRPVTMQQQLHRDGDFDVLIIHRHYGLMVCEVKAVGADRRNTPDLNKAVVGKVSKALKQLNKAKTVLNHLMSDMGPVQVTKTLVLPNVTSAELMQALSTAPQLQQDLVTCLDANNIPEAISRCLCADQIPTNADLESLCNQGDSPGDTNQSTSSSQTSVSPTFPLLSSWWENMTSQGAGPDPQMSDTVYDKLLARFCGPATTVEVPTVTAPRKAMAKPGKYTPARKVLRTEGEAVAETGLIHSLLALYPDQVDLLSDNTLCCVHLRGPPGTGKTIVLVLKAIQWLHQGHDVHVVSVVNESRAVSLLIERQLQCVLGSNPASGFGTVHRHVVQGFTYTDEANKLAALASDGELYVIADEVFGSTFSSPIALRPSVNSRDFECFINTLHPKIPSLSVWCASVQKLDSPPSWMCERQLTTPLRCPPTVTKEVAKSKEMKESDIPSYSPTPAPAATEGPPVRWLPHKGGQDGHSKGSPMECDVCGDAVVHLLLKELRVGQSSGSDPLQYRDVLLLAPERKTEVNSTTGIIFKLRENGVPVQVLTKDSEDSAVCDVALALKDEITVADPKVVFGLERRVVIATGSGKNDKYSNNRLFAMSRSTSLLVWIGERPGK